MPVQVGGVVAWLLCCVAVLWLSASRPDCLSVCLVVSLFVGLCNCEDPRSTSIVQQSVVVGKRFRN